jgi:general stress protein CsbA
MKTFNITWTVLFLLFAAVQYNDPDPFVWIALYLFAALLCFFASRRQNYPYLNIIGLAVYSVYAGYLLVVPDGVLAWLTRHHAESIVQTMQAEKPWIEATREFFGLLIIIAVILWNMIWLRKPKPQILAVTNENAEVL